MKRLLLPLLAALSLPTAVNAEKVELVNDGKYYQWINTDFVIPIGLRKGDWINAQFTGSDGSVIIEWYQFDGDQLISWTQTVSAPVKE